MIESASQLKSVLIWLSVNDDDFSFYDVTEDDWKLTIALIELLKPFEEITNEMSSSSFPTINLVWPNYLTLKKHLNSSSEERFWIIVLMHRKSS